MYKTLLLALIAVILACAASCTAWMYFDRYNNRKKLRRLDEYLRAKDRGAYRRREEAD